MSSPFVAKLGAIQTMCLIMNKQGKKTRSLSDTNSFYMKCIVSHYRWTDMSTQIDLLF